MVVYVTPAEKNGGILQFSVMMLGETLKIQDAVLFVPNSVDSKYYEDLSDKIVLYEKTKTVNGRSKKIQDLAEAIMDKNPDRVVFLEDSLLMQQLNYILVKKGIKTAIVVHDVIHHPYRNMKLREILVEIMRQRWMKKTVRQQNSILLLSNNSKEIFDERHRKKKAKRVVMNLGAHVPNVTSERPKDFPQINNYYLFFGRIDKYKGIADLCKAYTKLPVELKDKHKLAIAGSGQFSDLEKSLIENDCNIIALNRFIEDSEMVWLYEHAKVVVLPYIEASQSGVLPIAYHFSKPVIVSNQKGLLENIEKGKTGFSYRTHNELVDCLTKMLAVDFSEEILSYYERNFNWQKNICRMLEEI